MPQFTAVFGPLSATLHGLIVSSILLPAATVALLSGSVAEVLGRKLTIGYGALAFAVGAALEAGATSLTILICGRVIVGVGEGLFLSTLVVYICEISPPSRRGVLASLVQGLITVGLCLGYFLAYGTIRISSSLAWRLPLAIQAIVALALAIACFTYLPESPRWLTSRGRQADATAVWDALDVSSAEREKESLEQARNQPTLPTTLTGHFRHQFSQLRLVFHKTSRQQLLLGMFLMSFQQLSGIDGIFYYSPLLFRQAGLSSSTASFLASGVSALIIMLTTIPAFLLSDKIGRRPSTLYGGIVLFACMSLIGSLYASNAVHAGDGAARWVVIVTLYIYSVMYCSTWALGIKIFVTEIQPLETRAAAAGVAQAANGFMNFFVAFITPVLLAHSSFGAYFLFAGAIFTTLIVCVVAMPETRGKDLEEVQLVLRQHQASSSRLWRLCLRIGRWLGNNHNCEVTTGRTTMVTLEEVDHETIELAALDGVRSQPASRLVAE
ncbi:hypothetical protein FH972_023502 [Carpinus fangiana]|uniref:Major facilitator superfamily (MFS) profile domain-containing protein n=1 Tax=Carpinus fangiana TaxID=176857 RepID=A0A5N6KVC7_9ROSI|nr:hypothetical protein FH972_023502 [Carpinus fangiana]